MLTLNFERERDRSLVAQSQLELQSCAAKREVLVGFLMGFPSLTQKLMFITLDISIMKMSKRQGEVLLGDIYSEHFIILLEWSWGRRESSPTGHNYKRQGSAICQQTRKQEGEIKGPHFVNL